MNDAMLDNVISLRVLVDSPCTYFMILHILCHTILPHVSRSRRLVERTQKTSRKFSEHSQRILRDDVAFAITQTVFRYHSIVF